MTRNFSQDHVLIIGYARTGQATADFLLRRGAKVSLSNLTELEDDQELQALVDRGLTICPPGHPESILDEPIDYIVKNPGIPYQIPFVQEAVRRGIPIYTDVELASWVLKGQLIGITGSNGKSTVTLLTHLLLQHYPAGKAFLAGNIGIPVLELVDQIGADDLLVMELSSFQLEGTQEFHPKVAIINNIFEAHLDYHGSRSAYIEAKLKLIKNLDESDYLIYNYDQEELREWLKDSPAKLIPFAQDQVDDYVRKHGSYLEDEHLFIKGKKILSTQSIQIPGKHNISNVLAAITVANQYEISPSVIQEVVETYLGMPHRIQPVAEQGGRKFYNDSKATNTTATITALKSFHQPIHYIGGGLDRGNGFEDLKPYLTLIKRAYLYGESKFKMAEVFDQVEVAYELFDNLDQATQAAYKQAKEGQVILFSPACASWDQFKNFEERGDAFMRLVYHLLEISPYQEEGGSL
ncbi:UDP-N-acetylmuramoyl-L-alanine--D-glutamate ligase [Hutsoniella sourekii]|uniref:UDP-N-acetylmuramoyl-L-alanine--D-glutamate ligase n=1 Tax=Hutsoniella sourekii TaxID=87650 RepID=UPI0004B9974D|nr:UDP-N-acetylmuramoyl-L-alanine--D-glutamate ligase [Hutsoniella sourekii]